MMGALVRFRSAVIPGARSATRDPYLTNKGLRFMDPGSRTLRVLARDDSREDDRGFRARALRARPGMTGAAR